MKIYAHFYLVIAAGVMLFCLVVYGFIYDHKEYVTIEENPNSDEWIQSFKNVGIPSAIMDDIAHDDDTWYYNDMALCVGYGDWNDKCKKHETFCAGGSTNGNADDQARAILVALRNGWRHPGCPLLYSGAN